MGTALLSPLERLSSFRGSQLVILIHCIKHGGVLSSEGPLIYYIHVRVYDTHCTTAAGSGSI